MSWTLHSWRSFEDTVKEALADLAAEQGKDIVCDDMRDDGQYLDVRVGGEKLVLEHSADVLSDFQNDPKGSRKFWRSGLQDSYRRQIERLLP